VLREDRLDNGLPGVEEQHPHPPWHGACIDLSHHMPKVFLDQSESAAWPARERLRVCTHKCCQGAIQGFKPRPDTAFQGCWRRIKVVDSTEEVVHPSAGNLIVPARLQAMESLGEIYL